MDSYKIRVESREYAWKYFQLHAGQRMSIFNFFVLISAILTAGLAGALQKNGECQFIKIALSVGLLFVSFSFWKLDQRVRFLVKHAECILKKIETESVNKGENSEGISLFTQEEIKTQYLSNNRKWFCPFCCHLSYSKCFGIIYFIFAALGIIGIVLAFI